MAPFVFIFGLMLSALGAFGLFLALDLIGTDRGSAFLVAGSVALTGGLMMMTLAFVLARLRHVVLAVQDLADPALYVQPTAPPQALPQALPDSVGLAVGAAAAAAVEDLAPKQEPRPLAERKPLFEPAPLPDDVPRDEPQNFAFDLPDPAVDRETGPATGPQVPPVTAGEALMQPEPAPAEPVRFRFEDDRDGRKPGDHEADDQNADDDLLQPETPPAPPPRDDATVVMTAREGTIDRHDLTAPAADPDMQERAQAVDQFQPGPRPDGMPLPGSVMAEAPYPQIAGAPAMPLPATEDHASAAGDAHEPADGREIIGSYRAGDRSYTMFADGSVEATTSTGVHRFRSLEELKHFIETEVTQPA